MPRIFPLKPNFSAGEFGPRLSARVDFAKYANAAETMENFWPLIQGGMDTRPGTRYVGEVKDSDDRVRLVPFQFSVDAAYILEFGPGYIRVYKDHERLAVEVATPYANVSDLRELQFAQSADVLYIAHNAYAPRKLQRFGDTNWQLDIIEFVDGPYRVENDTDITITPSAASGNITLTASDDLFDSGHVGSLWRLKHSGIVKSASIAAEDNFTAAVKVEGSGDERAITVRLTGTWSATVTLQRSYDGGTTWVDFRTFQSNTDQQIKDGLSQTVHYRLGVKTGDYSSGTVAATLFYDGGETWGYCQITDVHSATSADATVKESFAEATATTGWREGSWSDYRGWPACVALYQQRLFWAGTASQLQTLWASASDDFENFTPGVEDADSFEFTIAGQEVNVIRALASAQFLWALTSGGEWIARATTQDEPLTPTNIQIKQQTTRGAARIQPVLVDRALIYVQRFANKVYEELFTFESDGYVAFDMTEVAEHIAGPGFVEVAYQREPTPRLFFVRSDGEVSVLTYRREQEVFAWSRLKLRDGDAIESVAVIPGASQDEVWFAVRREIGSATVRYVEYLAPEDFGADQADAYFVDCGITYDGAATSTITGLDHLEGETVQVLADGATHPERTVSGGEITLVRDASVVHAGLGYESVYKSLKLEGGNPAGTAIGQRKRIWKVVLSLLRSLGGRLGPSLDDLESIPYRTVGDDMDAPPPLFTGERIVNFRGGHELDPRIVIKRDQPLPLTVLALAPQVQVNPK